MNALTAAREAGLRVPEDLSIVGFDDIELAAFSSPSLTTVVQPKTEIGTLAAQMLLERVAAEGGEPRRVLLDPQLKIRTSTTRAKP